MEQNLLTPQIINTDINAMKQYLADVYNLEKNIHKAECCISELERKMWSLGQKEEYRKCYFSLNDAAFWALYLSIIPGIIVLILNLEAVTSWRADIMDYAILIGSLAIVYVIAVIICSINQVINNIKRNMKIDSLIYEQEKRLKKENEEKEKYRGITEDFINAKMDSEEKLQKLYNMNILFEKYQNFVAVSQIYEYFMSGRCTQLEGHEGAYNIFEYEIRQDIIILQLDRIISQLEDIKRNQYMIYQAITETNEILRRIENNTAVTAYNTSVVATNSTIVHRYYY